ncbi:FAD/NAD(P)-binding domain-containing protein [Hypoxylon sp. FL1150]|nr:FAD/NAD(P)-binding domain-containing protein [Hypoxylon sp. FL1150]
MSPSIRNAIIGDGLVGASLLHALLKFSHLDVHIFVSAPTFKEAAARCLDRAGAVPMRGVRFMLPQGEGAGSMADEVDDIVQEKRLTSIVHRAALLQELLGEIPPDRMHVSKKLQRIDQTGPITLYFVDGTTHECDILVGVDGIHSTARKVILGEKDPASSPRNNGPAQESLGKQLVDINDARKYGWAGQNAFLLHNILSSGKLVQFAIASNDKDTELELANKLLCSQREHKTVSGPICITGDAAHSTTPWQGSGAGMSIEDSLILSTLLGHAESHVEAIAALKIYDHVRRPRTQLIVESSRIMGTILTGNNEDMGLDPKKLKSLTSRWDFIQASGFYSSLICSN